MGILHTESSLEGVAERATPRPRRALLATTVALALAVGYATFDLFAPVRSDMRAFDPDAVARLETAMWRSYYARERLRLFGQLGEMLRTQYRLPFLRSNAVAFRAARAAFVFKDGKSRADYERALPDLVDYYAALREVSAQEFDVRRAAELELEWWIVHRERHSHPPGALARSLAELPAEVYRLPAERFAEHARLRAEAMEIRDTRAEAGGVGEEDWARIEALLVASWRDLHARVNGG